MGKGVTIDKLGVLSLENPHGYISFEEYTETEVLDADIFRRRRGDYGPGRPRF